MRVLKELKILLSNQRGIALMMIMTSIILLMAIYGEFTFDSKISRIKATNILDRSQSKLLAESGLQLAMARLRLYKEAFNYVEGNQNAKGAVSSQLLNQLWEVPFMYPIPVGENATRAFKDTVEKFQEETLLEGQMRVTIQNISNRMNLNLLRIDMTKVDPNQPIEDQIDQSTLDTSDNAIQSKVTVDQSLFFLLKRLVDEKKEKDEAFEDRYGNLNYQSLISNLKFYMSDYQSMMRDPFGGEAESTFQRIPLTPKYGPLTSASELYAIPGWDDELIELIQNEFSVYPTAQIDLNKLTANMLKLLVPTITEDQIKDFFEYRDDPVQPKFFNTLEEFQKYMVDIARIISETDFKSRMELFTKAGVSFGSNPNLFKITSVGQSNRSIYTLIAYVLLPTKPNTAGTTAGAAAGATAGATAGSQGGTTAGTGAGGTTAGAQGGGTATDKKTQLLEPRIIEIQIN